MIFVPVLLLLSLVGYPIGSKESGRAFDDLIHLDSSMIKILLSFPPFPTIKFAVSNVKNAEGVLGIPVKRMVDGREGSEEQK